MMPINGKTGEKKEVESSKANLINLQITMYKRIKTQN